MTFVPLLGQFLLRSKPASSVHPSTSASENRGFAKLYYAVGRWSIDHRKSLLAGAFFFLIGGGILVSSLDSSFFPYACGANAVCAQLVQTADRAALDDKNPDASLRTRPLCGIELGKDFALVDDTHAQRRKLYDPESQLR